MFSALGTWVDSLSTSLLGHPVGPDPFSAFQFIGLLGMATWVLLLVEVEVGARTRYRSRVAALLADPTGRGTAVVGLLHFWPVPLAAVGLVA